MAIISFIPTSNNSPSVPNPAPAIISPVGFSSTVILIILEFSSFPWIISEDTFLKKLRGFVNGGVGPKDGDDFIGGNYYAVLNFNSTLPQILPNSQNIDISTFLDVANLWGVDDSSLDESSEIRSSIGLGVDWFTPVGPLNFSFAQPISKSSTDKTETFRFNLGTSF